MSSSPKRTALVTSAPSSVGVTHSASSASPGFDPRHPQQRALSEVTTLSRVGRFLVVSARKPPRILLADAALALYELHIMLQRSITATVKSSGFLRYISPQ
jgi:hypothetical protein